MTHLSLHLPGHQPGYNAGNVYPDQIRDLIEGSMTALMAFVSYNAQNEHSRQFLCYEFPQHFVYIRKIVWQKRQKRTAVGRIYSASPFLRGRYYLHLLLTVVQGATSFENLRTVDGVVKHRHSVYDTLFGMTQVLLLLLVSWKVLEVCRNV